MSKKKELAACTLHWSAFVVPGGLCVLFLLLMALTLFSNLAGDATKETAILFFVAAVASVIYIIIKYRTTKITLYDTKLVGQKGFIRSKILTTPLSKVQDIGLSNGLSGKILGYHTVTISTAGGAGTEFVFRHMAGARDFADAVHDQIMVDYKSSNT